MPTLQQIRYLVALADALHFHRAAEACHVTQPTLSAQLRQLEARLGARLVEQVRPRVILTPLGITIAERGRGVLREVEQMRALARSGASAAGDAVRLGVAATLGSYLLPYLMPELLRDRPDLSLASREDSPDALLHALEQGALDLLVLPAPLSRPNLSQRPFFREPIMAILPRSHPLAAVAEIDPAALAGEVVLAPGPGQPLHDQARQFCEATGARLSSDHDGANLDGLRQMVAMGMGVSLLPALYVRSEVIREERVVARSLGAKAPVRHIGFAWRRGTAREGLHERLAEQMCVILRREVPEVQVVA